MPTSVKSFQTTPNPNALKCVLATPIGGSIRSFRAASEAQGDQLGRALFGVPGVTSVLINPEWITINKTPESDWSSVKKGVQAALNNV